MKNIYLDNRIVIGQIMRANRPMDWGVGANVATQVANELNLDKSLSFSIDGVDKNKLDKFAEEVTHYTDYELGQMLADYTDKCHGWILSELEKNE